MWRGAGDEAARHAPAASAAGAGAGGAARGPLLRLDRISKCFGDNLVLDEISFDVGAGEVIAIVGPSGGGKSTLLRCVNFLERPTSGSVFLDGVELGFTATRGGRRPAGDRELAAVRRDVGMVFQSFNLFPHRTVLDNIVIGQVHALGRDRGAAERRAHELLERVGLTGKAKRHPGNLSGGEQQRVAIARALALDPKLMLFDEPTSAIDPEVKVDVLEVMTDLAASGMTMLVATHEMHFAEDVADRVIFMADAQIVEQGPPSEVLRHPRNERTQRFLRAVLER